MRIVWNKTEVWFEAQLETGPNWAQDQQAAQSAGFRTDGPPAWIWTTDKLKVLEALRKNRPPNLTISPEAKLEYDRLSAQKAGNDAILEQLRQAKATLPTVETSRAIPTYWQGKESIGREDLPVSVLEKVRPAERAKWPEPETRCRVCQEPVYFYESPDICLWCEKGELYT